MKKYIILSLLSVQAISCSKVIDIDYESVDPLYVIEATLSIESSQVKITQTCDMEEPLTIDPITSAIVTLTDELGAQTAFAPNEEGAYNPTEPLSLITGQDYTLSVEIGDQMFSSTSHLYAAPTISDVGFTIQPYTADFNLIFCSFAIDDIPNQTNYYRYRFRYFANDNEQSGEPSWSLIKEVVDGDQLWLMTHLYTMDRDFEDGDEVTIEVQAIDKTSYEYFTTLAQSGSSSTNPTFPFGAECLGYFTAYSTVSQVVEFYWE